jgi:ribosome-binding factor A
MAAVKRATRVAGRMREELAVAMRELGDPRIQGVLITRVEFTDDLQTARVYVRRALGGDDQAALKASLKALGAAAGRLRRVVAKTLAMRYTPELRFFYDDSLDKTNRIEELLREVRRDDEGR